MVHKCDITAGKDTQRYCMHCEYACYVTKRISLAQFDENRSYKLDLNEV